MILLIHNQSFSILSDSHNKSRNWKKWDISIGYWHC